ncbi:flagellar FliJ family protein [Vibrio harveyi]|nr:flagellar FliJ family protein [Vibrio harveyi]
MKRRLRALSQWRTHQEIKLDEVKGHYASSHNVYHHKLQHLDIINSLKKQYSFINGEQISALLMKETVRFKGQLEVLSELQKQEICLSEIELRTLNENLVKQNKNIEICDKLIKEKESVNIKKELKAEQNMFDEISIRNHVRKRT